MTLEDILNELRSRIKNPNEVKGHKRSYRLGRNKGISEAIRLLEDSQKATSEIPTDVNPDNIEETWFKLTSQILNQEDK